MRGHSQSADCGDQIPAYIQQLTPVRLRADTRVLDHGYVNGHAYSRQAVLQALTAVMVDKYGMPRVRCVSGSPLLDIPEVQQMQQQPAQQAQPVRRAARKPVYIGTQWLGFNPRVVVVILRPLRNRIIDFIILLDLRRLPIVILFARRIGIRLGIAGVDLRVFDVDLVVVRPPRAVVAPPPGQAPLPLPIQGAPPLPAAPAQPPVQAQQGVPAAPPAGVPPVVAGPPVIPGPPALPPPINAGIPGLDPGVIFSPAIPPVIRAPSHPQPGS